MKPSERILKIAEEINPSKNPIEDLSYLQAVDLRLEAITRYLDEKYEKENQECANP